MTLYYIFINHSFIVVWFTENCWFLISAAAICCDMFWLKYVKKIQPHTDVYLGKGGVFNSLFREYENIILWRYTEKLLSGGFIKINCNKESENIVNELFIHCQIKIHWSVLYFEWVLKHAWFKNIIHWSFRKY